MQSYLQYRKFGKRVQQQLERDKQKHDLIRAINTGDTSALMQQQQKSLPNDEVTDPEKAEDHGSNHSGGDENQGLEKEEVEEEDHAYQDSESSQGQNQPEDPPQNNAAVLGITLRRTNTSRSTRSVGTKIGHALTGVHVRDRTTREGGDRSRQVFVVGYEGDNDIMNPHNWSRTRRFAATFIVASIGAVVGIASSIDSSILRNASAEFGVSEVVESLATGEFISRLLSTVSCSIDIYLGIFLVGFGGGALFAGPISETVGRNPVYITTLFLYMIWIMASALAPNIGAQLVFRFFAGFFASTPLTCAGGSIADLWNPMERVFAFPIFANAAFLGPILGPVIGGWISISPLVGWRWTEWITLIISGFVLTLVVFLQPETYTPIILKWKASHLRRLTGDERFAAPVEVRDDTFLKRLTVALYRPFELTIREPIVILIALYLSVVYIILFTFLDGYDYIFAEIHGTNEGITGTCFLGIAAGLFLATLQVPLVYRWAKQDLQQIKEQGGDQLPPEFRLWFSMLGGAFAIPASLFWMGWTSDSNISIWSPLIASVLFGYGILCVFISSYQYIIDSYEIYAASALASVTLLRYFAAGGMVVAGIPFYQNEGVRYTLTILACISALLVPVPYVFFKVCCRTSRAISYE